MIKWKIEENLDSYRTQRWKKVRERNNIAEELYNLIVQLKKGKKEDMENEKRKQKGKAKKSYCEKRTHVYFNNLVY